MTELERMTTTLDSMSINYQVGVPEELDSVDLPQVAKTILWVDKMTEPYVFDVLGQLIGFIPAIRAHGYNVGDFSFKMFDRRFTARHSCVLLSSRR